jgi:cytochrome c55X
MRRGIRGGAAAWIVATAVAAGVTGVALAEVGDDRKLDLLEMLDETCANCHGPGLAGGMGGPLTPVALAGKDVKDLAEVILHGRPGTNMPAFATSMTAEEAAWLAARLQRGHAAP